jgi:SAM-dependent methyltransferase
MVCGYLVAVSSKTPTLFTACNSALFAHYNHNCADLWSASAVPHLRVYAPFFLQLFKENRKLHLLDVGCGPGHDLRFFKHQGHHAIGLDGAGSLVTMAKVWSGCDVWHQQLTDMALPQARFDGIFCQAVLYLLPERDLPAVLGDLVHALVPGGCLFLAQPSGNTGEKDTVPQMKTAGDVPVDRWFAMLDRAGLGELQCHDFPEHQPTKQPWLAISGRKR